MYDVYIDNILLPVPPEEIIFDSKNLNKTYTLTNGGEINITKSEGLKDIKMSVMLPSKRYSFSKYQLFLFIPPIEFLNHFEKLKKDKNSFNLIILRSNAFDFNNFDTNLKVTLENYTVREKADNSGDVVVDLTFKEYKDIEIKVLKILNESNSSNLKNSEEALKYINKFKNNNTTKKAFIKRSRPLTTNRKKQIRINGKSLIWQVARSLYGSTDKLNTLMKNNKITTYIEKINKVIDYE